MKKYLLFLLTILTSLSVVGQSTDATLLGLSTTVKTNPPSSAKTGAALDAIINSKVNYIGAYTAGGTDTYTATVNPGIVSYVANTTYDIRFTNANTGAATLNLNGLGAIPLKKNVTVALSSGDLIANGVYRVAYDGTNFQIVGAISSGGAGTVTNVTGTANQIDVATGTSTPVISLANNTALPGAPTAATAAATVNNTQIATTAFVKGVTAAVYSVVNYGAQHDYETVSDANVTSGTPTLTSATAAFVTDDTGKTIRVFGAGAAGVDLITTMTFVNSTTVTLGTNASTTISAKKIEWGTDDTPFIQAAIDACHTANGGTVYFPNGRYFIAGALITSLNGVNPNCQITIPLTSTYESQRTIRLLGESVLLWPRGPFISLGDPVQGVILKSIIVGSGTTPSVFGSAFFFNGFVDSNFSNPIFENIAVQVKSVEGVTHIAPKMSAFKLGEFEVKQVRNCMAFTESDMTQSVIPVDITYGFLFSKQGHTDVHSVFDQVTASGFYYGFYIEEHDYATRLNAFGCLNAIGVGGNALGSHCIELTGPITGNWCKYGITFLAPKDVNFQYYSEKWPGSVGPSRWYDATADVFFPSTQAINGNIIGTALGAGGAVESLVVSGAHTGTFRVIDLKQGFINTFGGKTQPTTAAAGGTGFLPGDATLDPGYLEVNRGTASGATDKGFAVLALNHNSQTGTAHAVGSLQFLNLASADADKRLYTFSVITNGAIDAGQHLEFINSGSALTQISQTTSAYRRLLGPLYVGSVAVAPTAKIHVAAGSTAASSAPLKFTSGALMTTAEAGAEEFLTDKFYGTITTGTARKEFTLNDIALTSGRVSFSTTNGRQTDDADLTFSGATLTATQLQIGTGATMVGHLTGTGTLDFGSTVAGTSTDLTVTVTGAADGDVVAIGVPNGSTLTNGVFTAWVSAANTVTIRFSNNSLAATLDPASGSFRASVLKY